MRDRVVTQEEKKESKKRGRLSQRRKVLEGVGEESCYNC
jgi:hypothetical protein